MTEKIASYFTLYKEVADKILNIISLKHVCYVNLMNDAYLDRTLLRSSTKVLSSSSSAIKSLSLDSLSKTVLHFLKLTLFPNAILKHSRPNSWVTL